MKIKIAIATATRADYGLLRPIIIKLNKLEDIDVRVVVTGAHLSNEFGHTYKEIEADGIQIDRKIEMLLSSDTNVGVVKSMSLAMAGFSEYFNDLEPDVIILLGDRYETLAIATAAMMHQIAIVHLYGGEITEGAIDDVIRHSITKMSDLHFTSTEAYKRRVVQMGENPERVFSVGAMGVECAMKVETLTKKSLAESIKIELDTPYVLVTFHPMTKGESCSENEIKGIIEACICYKELTFIFTKANADVGGRKINQLIEEATVKYDHIKLVDSLGSIRYLSALKSAAFVMGNSSSALVEAPSFGIPTINIGDRQKGRLQGESIINCPPIKDSICESIDLAMSSDFKKKIAGIDNPYGDGETSDRIINQLIRSYKSGQYRKKVFYDINN